MTRFGRVVYITLSGFLLLASACPLTAQERNWWIVSAEQDLHQRGALRELLGRKKVYVSVSITDTRTNLQLNTTERNDISDLVKEAIGSQRDLRLVTYPEEAEFAVLVRIATGQGLGPNFSLVLDSEVEVALDVLVVIPGSQRRDGTRVPRIVWEAYSPNAQTTARSATRFAVDGFLLELKKLHEKK